MNKFIDFLVLEFTELHRALEKKNEIHTILVGRSLNLGNSNAFQQRKKSPNQRE